MEINNQGVKAYPKPVRLGDAPVRIESGAPKLRGRYRALLPVFVAVLLMVTG